jgi:hypothetical protein
MKAPAGLWARGLVGLLAVALGCARAPAPVRTGAEETARAYAEAVVARDWPRAYACLAESSKERHSAEQFAALAHNYYLGIGFAPSRAQVRFGEERGEEASARIVFTGKEGARSRSHRDALFLRRSAGRWGVVLPDRFGRSR